MDTSSLQSSPKLNIDVSDRGIVLNKNFLIVSLLVLLIFSLLGINILSLFGSVFQLVGNLFQSIVNLVKPLILRILSLFGYTTGAVINTTADIVGETTKTGIDVASGAVQSVGNLLKDGSKNLIDKNSKKHFDNALNLSTIKTSIPDADNTNSNIQTAIGADKASWCLVGEHQGRRGCVEIDQDTKCMSGQIFPSQHQCLNPNLTTNAQ